MNKRTHPNTTTWWEPIKRAVDYHGGQQKMAEAIGCSQASVSLWLSRSRKPNPIHAKRIQATTQGLVKASEILPEIFD